MRTYHALKLAGLKFLKVLSRLVLHLRHEAAERLQVLHNRDLQLGRVLVFYDIILVSHHRDVHRLRRLEVLRLEDRVLLVLELLELRFLALELFSEVLVLQSEIGSGPVLRRHLEHLLHQVNGFFRGAVEGQRFQVDDALFV